MSEDRGEGGDSGQETPPGKQALLVSKSLFLSSQLCYELVKAVFSSGCVSVTPDGVVSQ